jgi:hypothetical protein
VIRRALYRSLISALSLATLSTFAAADYYFGNETVFTAVGQSDGANPNTLHNSTNYWAAFRFTAPASGTLNQFDVRLRRAANTFTGVTSIYKVGADENDPLSAGFSHSTSSGSWSVTANGTWANVTPGGVTLTQGQVYWIVLDHTGGVNDNNYWFMNTPSADVDIPNQTPDSEMQVAYIQNAGIPTPLSRQISPPAASMPTIRPAPGMTLRNSKSLSHL